MSACCAKFRFVSTRYETRSKYWNVRSRKLTWHVGRRMRKLVAEDAANGHPILQLCRRNIFVHLDIRGLALCSLAGRPDASWIDRHCTWNW